MPSAIGLAGEVARAYSPQSDADARVYIWKLMLLPPPRMFAQGTMERLPRMYDDFMVSV